MAKVRVYELAKELGIESKSLLALLKAQGHFVRSASSTIEPPVVRQIRSTFARRADDSEMPRHDLRIGADRAATEHQQPPTPASIYSTWRAGAVPAPNSPDLTRNIERLETRFPEFKKHRESLRKLGSQILFAGNCKEPGFRDCAVVLVRLSGAIEAAFGLTREVMIFYSPHLDLQVRTFQAARKTLAGLGREVSPDLIFLSAPDPRLRVKLDDWLRPDFMAIPLEIDMDDNPIALISRIRDYIYSRDLFYETTPVRGSRFFGRRTLLHALRDDAKSQRVAGLFGLRKAGKTSVLLQLSDMLADSDTVTILVDLEAFPSPPSDPTPDILTELRRRLLEVLKQKDLRSKELTQTPKSPSIVEFKTALQALLVRLGKDGVSVLLLLDEIEYLTPSDKVDVAEGDMPQIAQMLGALRSVVQETGNFTFIISGLTSAIVESGRLYGRPNPLFSWAKSYYLGPFERIEADDLATSIGGKMGIEISPAALEALYDASGGHAFLYRNLASRVVGSLPVDVYRRNITRSDVLHALLPWKASITGNVSEMISHVKRYYATEGVLLDILLESPDEFSSLAEDEPQALDHLLNLGLIHRANHGYALNSLLELM